MTDFNSIDFSILSDAQLAKVISEEAKKIAAAHANDEKLIDPDSDPDAILAPECFNPDCQPAALADIWAFGAELYQGLSGNMPFGEEGGKSQASGSRLALIQGDYPQEVKRLTYRCLDKNPNRRPKAEEIASFTISAPNAKPSIGAKKSKSNKGLVVTLSIAIVALLAIGAFVLMPSSSKPTAVEDDMAEAEPTETIEQSGFKPFEELTALANSGDSEALFLLSRLYFESESEGEVCEDSIQKMKSYYQTAKDNVKAHQLLELAVQADPQNYKAAYELGLDYFGGPRRDASYKRDAKQALKYLKSAHECAIAAQDLTYQILASDQIQKLEKR